MQSAEEHIDDNNIVMIHHITGLNPSLTDETNNKNNYILTNVQYDPIDKDQYIKYVKSNNTFAINKNISMRKHHKLQKSIEKSPKQNEILIANKFRFKNGHLEINLMSEINGKYSTWISPHLHPNICLPVANYIENHQIKITGNPEKLINSVYSA